MQVNIFWFRRDLRLSDNHGLYQALQRGKPVVPVFIFDKNIIDNLPEKEYPGAIALYNALSELQSAIRKYSSSLHIIYDTPLNAFTQLAEEYRISEVFTNTEYGTDAEKRDAETAQLLEKKGIKFSSFKDQVIFEKNDLLSPDGNPYTVFSGYAQHWKQQLNADILSGFDSAKNLTALLKTRPAPLPSLKEMGLNYPSAFAEVSAFDPPGMPSTKGIHGMFAQLHTGTESIRRLVKVALEMNEDWLNELIWREFYLTTKHHFSGVELSGFILTDISANTGIQERNLNMVSKQETAA